MNVNKWKRALVGISFSLLLCFGMTACGQGGHGDPAPEDTVDTVAVGEWADTAMISDTDGKAYPVRIRVTGTSHDQKKIRAAIEDYNLSAWGDLIQVEDEEALGDLEYVTTTYEVEFPEDFPEDEYGIVEVVPDFTVVNRQGESVFKSGNTEYTELGTTKEIVSPQMGYDFWAGDTYKGETLYLMVKDGDYVLCQTCQHDRVYFEVQEQE